MSDDLESVIEQLKGLHYFDVDQLASIVNQLIMIQAKLSASLDFTETGMNVLRKCIGEEHERKD